MPQPKVPRKLFDPPRPERGQTDFRNGVVSALLTKLRKLHWNHRRWAYKENRTEYLNSLTDLVNAHILVRNLGMHISK